MDLNQLKKLHDKAYESGQDAREKAANDMIFYFITQWDDINIQASSQLKYRGQFNLLKKAVRQIMSDLMSNKVQIDFSPINNTSEDAAEILDGMYRKDSNHNLSLEAYENAKLEAIVCGVGAWQLYTEYVSDNVGNVDQHIKRKPIFEANNTIFWDPNSKCLDKSDARFVSVLKAYSKEGYKNLVKDLTGRNTKKVNPESFKTPEQAYNFQWLLGEGEKIYVVEFYHRKKIKDIIYTLSDPFGQNIYFNKSDIKKHMDDLLDKGFSIVNEKKIERWQVKRYVASGEEILKRTIIPGQHIPIVPCYGEHAVIEGEEYYEGTVRPTKDPQRLQNFQMSYLTDIVARSPVQQPIFTREQIAGFEHMYKQNGVENWYPFLLVNDTDKQGNAFQNAPIGVMPEQKVPGALMTSIELTRKAVEDVANPGLPQSTADPDISGKAVLALQARLDMQSLTYQEHYKYAKRRDAEIYASMAAVIYDTNRQIVIETPEGVKRRVELMKSNIGNTGELGFINDLRNAEFEVYSKLGPDYTSQKEQVLDRIERIIPIIPPEDPMREILILNQINLTDGMEFSKGIKEYVNKRLVLLGAKKPETPEEQKALEAATQAPKEDANMVLAKAEELKGKADVMGEQREGIEMQLDDENTKIKHQIDAYKAETDRMQVMVEAKKTGVEVEKTGVETVGAVLDNRKKLKELRGDKIKKED
jgi:hypothetical protein